MSSQISLMFFCFGFAVSLQEAEKEIIEAVVVDAVGLRFGICDEGEVAT